MPEGFFGKSTANANCKVLRNDHLHVRSRWLGVIPILEKSWLEFRGRFLNCNPDILHILRYPQHNFFDRRASYSPKRRSEVQQRGAAIPVLLRSASAHWN